MALRPLCREAGDVQPFAVGRGGAVLGTICGAARHGAVHAIFGSARKWRSRHPGWSTAESRVVALGSVRVGRVLALRASG